MAKRDHKTSVTGTNYVMHLPRPAPYTDYVWCGRIRSAVNSYPGDYVSPYAPEEEEQTCLACIKTRAFAGKIGSAEEALPAGQHADEACVRCGEGPGSFNTSCANCKIRCRLDTRAAAYARKTAPKEAT